ncbi:hypothetical protein Tco_0656158 [Tanacetum coccineum]|uniref:Uncharacterized protein n=1 Tax=Tanacetum coccineum TaxID=301880 RepID=A0ABQ4X7Z2_9ASTR
MLDEAQGKPPRAAFGVRISHGDYDIKEAVTHVMRRSSVPVMEIMPIDQVLFDQLSSSHVYRAFYMAFKEKARRSSRRRLRASKGPSMGRRPGTLTGPTIGASRRRPRGFEEKAKGQKRMLHPLREYVITLYTRGKIRTRVTVTLISGAEEAILYDRVEETLMYYVNRNYAL